MSHYNCMLIDLDNTLLDFDSTESDAIRATLERFGLPADDAAAAKYHAINQNLWKALERGEIRRDKLKTLRFEKLLAEIGQHGDPAAMNEVYGGLIAAGSKVIPGAIEFLEDVEDYVTIAVVTNGLQKTQEARLAASGIGKFADGVFVSERMGVSKPDRRFLQTALEKLGVTNLKKVIVVGDSLSADISGGSAAGIDTCWCNFKQEDVSDLSVKPTYVVRDYEELKAVLLEQEELDHLGEKKKHQS